MVKKLRNFNQVDKLTRDQVKVFLDKENIDYTNKQNTTALKNKLLKHFDISKPAKVKAKSNTKKKPVAKKKKAATTTKKNKIALKEFSLKQIGNDIIIITPDKKTYTKAFAKKIDQKKVIALVKKYNKNNLKKDYDSIIKLFTKKITKIKKAIKKSNSNQSLEELIAKVKDPELKQTMMDKLQSKTDSVEKPKAAVTTKSTRRGEY